MSISYWLSKKNDQTLNFDYCIVGGGIAGLSTAYWLEKKEPKAKIAIIERNKVGFGASGRNGGFVTCGSAEHFSKLEKQFGVSKAVEIWRFSEENRKLLHQEIFHDDPSSVQFLSTGACTVAPSRDDWERYQKLAHTMKSNGIDVRLMESQELVANYGVRNFEGAIEYLHDGVIHPVMLLQKMKSRLKNTQIFENEEVFHIESGKIISEQYRFQCPKILLTLNGYLSLLLENWTDHVQPQRGQVLVTEPLPAFVKGPCYLTKHLCYFRQLPGGELLIGGFRTLDLEKENTFLDQQSEKIQSALLDFAKNYFAFGDRIRPRYRWSGIMGFTKDGQMLIGEHPHMKDVHLMAGCSSHGMGLSFHAAKVLVESLSGGTIPEHLNLQRIASTLVPLKSISPRPEM